MDIKRNYVALPEFKSGKPHRCQKCPSDAKNGSELPRMGSLARDQVSFTNQEMYIYY